MKEGNKQQHMSLQNQNNTFKQTQQNRKNQQNNSNNKQYRAGDWICLVCNNLNFSFRNQCNRCKTQTKKQNYLQNLRQIQDEQQPQQYAQMDYQQYYDENTVQQPWELQQQQEQEMYGEDQDMQQCNTPKLKKDLCSFTSTDQASLRTKVNSSSFEQSPDSLQDIKEFQWGSQQQAKSINQKKKNLQLSNCDQYDENDIATKIIFESPEKKPQNGSCMMEEDGKNLRLTSKSFPAPAQNKQYQQDFDGHQQQPDFLNINENAQNIYDQEIYGQQQQHQGGYICQGPQGLQYYSSSQYFPYQQQQETINQQQYLQMKNQQQQQEQKNNKNQEAIPSVTPILQKIKDMDFTSNGSNKNWFQNGNSEDTILVSGFQQNQSSTKQNTSEDQMSEENSSENVAKKPNDLYDEDDNTNFFDEIQQKIQQFQQEGMQKGGSEGFNIW